MKNVSLKVKSVLIAGSFLLVASCGENTSPNDKKQSDNIEREHPQQGEMTKEDNLSSLLNNYFALSENLSNDSGSDAAKASEKLRSSLKDFKDPNLSENELEEVEEIMESAIEHAEHITENASDIHHQREHFVLLSIDIKDLIEIVGTDEKLYEAYCPMADNNEGAIWVTNQKEIKNPYMGQKMPKCGKINGEIN